MFSTHNNVCRYFTIALTTPKTLLHAQTHALLTLSWQGPGVLWTIRVIFRVSWTIRRHIVSSMVVPLVVIATNHYNTRHIQIHCITKKKKKNFLIKTHKIFHSLWPFSLSCGLVGSLMPPFSPPWQGPQRGPCCSPSSPTSRGPWGPPTALITFTTKQKAEIDYSSNTKPCIGLHD